MAQIYKNVGDGIDIDEANSSLISTLQGFKLQADDAEHIIDVFNEVDKLASYYSNVIACIKCTIVTISVKSQGWFRPRKDCNIYNKIIYMGI